MSSEAPANYRFGKFTLSESSRRLTCGGSAVPVTPKAFDLLQCLVQRAGQVVSRDELLRVVWPDAVVEEANLSQQIFGLRRALGDCSGYVATIPGRGYQFVEPVTVAVDEQPDRPTGSESTVAIEGTAATRIETGSRRNFWWAGVAALAALVAGVAWMAQRHFRRPASTQYCSVLLADFRNTTGNPNLDATLRQVMEVELGQSPFLSVLSRAEVGELLQQMGKDPNVGLSPDVAREVCERANHQVLITGELAKLGGKYVLTVQASDCASGKLLAGSSRTAASEDGLLNTVNEAAVKLRTALGESSASLRRFSVPVQRATTSSLEALKAYSLAAELEDHGRDPATTLRMYRRAVALDPNFAMGYAALANLYYANDEQGEAAEAARQAFHLSAHVTERERLEIQFHYQADTEEDLEGAIATAQTWAATYPHDWQPLILMAGLENDLGQYPAAIAAGRGALALAPSHALIYSVLARAERRSGNYAETRRLGRDAMLRGAMSGGLHGTLYQAAFAERDAAALQTETDWAMQSGSWFAMAVLGDAAATEGRMTPARKLFAQASAKAIASGLSEAANVVLLDEAGALFALGDAPEARKLVKSAHATGWSDRADLVSLQARLGDEKPALAFLADAKGNAQATLLQRYDVPRVQAALALQAGHADQAVAVLEAARPYELSDFRALSLRGEALEQAGRYAEAVTAYRLIVNHSGVDPVSVLHPLARFGLARCLRKLGLEAESEAEYAALREEWRDADASLPVVQRAARWREDFAGTDGVRDRGMASRPPSAR